jgi:hypothetical protein
MRASAGAGVTMGFMDVPNSVKECELAAEATPGGVWHFLDLVARCFFTSVFLISIVYSYCACSLRGLSSGAKQGGLKARRKNYYLQHTLFAPACD